MLERDYLGYDMDMKRRIVSIVLCLVLGAVINVAVAWIFAWFISQPIQNRQPGLLGRDNYYFGIGDIVQPSWYVMTWWEIGSTQICSEPFQRLEEDIGPEFSNVLREDGGVELFNFPSDIRPNHPLDMTERAQIEPLVEDFRGWPLYSMRCSFSIRWLGRPPGARTHDGIELEFKSQQGYGYGWMGVRALPLRPIWSGFIINTLFYGVFVWLAVPGEFALRRLLRAKRGLCMKCAYPIGTGEVCTECGAAVTPR